MNKLKLDKLYYSIGEVAELFGVSKSLIRYWESEFTSLKPHKNSKGDRRFTRQNIEQLRQIYILVKERGFTLEGAKNEIRQQRSRNLRKTKLLNKLIGLKKELEDMKQEIKEEKEDQD